MSNKVKVTQDQADAFENFKRFFKENNVTPMTKEKLIDVIKLGYEVEPEFKEKDWVVKLNDYDQKVYQIVRIEDRGIVLDDKNEWIYWEVDGVNQAVYVQSSMLRHATPSEIAEEKERRFFARNDREPWELKRQDVLTAIDGGYPVIVKDVSGGHPRFYGGNVYLDINDVKEEYKVACFSENRLDVSE